MSWKSGSQTDRIIIRFATVLVNTAAFAHAFAILKLP
jgi:hypothetical protein